MYNPFLKRPVSIPPLRSYSTLPILPAVYVEPLEFLTPRTVVMLMFPAVFSSSSEKVVHQVYGEPLLSHRRVPLSTPFFLENPAGSGSSSVTGRLPPVEGSSSAAFSDPVGSGAYVPRE